MSLSSYVASQSLHHIHKYIADHHKNKAQKFVSGKEHDFHKAAEKYHSGIAKQFHPHNKGVFDKLGQKWNQETPMQRFAGTSGIMSGGMGF